jgi:hypothetical protein
MNRTKAGWGQYFTEPLPNIGLFLCRGNNRTARVFELAWNKYLGMLLVLLYLSAHLGTVAPCWCPLNHGLPLREAVGDAS